MPLIDIEYIREDSPVHRMHPFVLIVFEICVAIAAASFNHPLALAGLMLLVLCVILIAKIPLHKLRYMWITVAVASIFIFTQGIWFTSFGALQESAFEPHVMFHLWPAWLPGDPHVPFTLEGAVFGLSLGMRFCAIALAFPILVMTIHPADLTNALASIRIFGRRIPYNFIFVFVNAIRYVPTISKQFDETMDAQRARGVEFDRGGIVSRIRAILSLLIPVVTSSLISGRELTLALETRGFGSENERTCLRTIRFRRADSVLAVLLFTSAAACVVVAQTLHVGMLEFTPGLVR